MWRIFLLWQGVSVQKNTVSVLRTTLQLKLLKRTKSKCFLLKKNLAVGGSEQSRGTPLYLGLVVRWVSYLWNIFYWIIMKEEMVRLIYVIYKRHRVWAAFKMITCVQGRDVLLHEMLKYSANYYGKTEERKWRWKEKEKVQGREV